MCHTHFWGINTHPDISMTLFSGHCCGGSARVGANTCVIMSAHNVEGNKYRWTKMQGLCTQQVYSSWAEHHVFQEIISCGFFFTCWLWKIQNRWFIADHLADSSHGDYFLRRATWRKTSTKIHFVFSLLFFLIFCHEFHRENYMKKTQQKKKVNECDQFFLFIF